MLYDHRNRPIRRQELKRDVATPTVTGVRSVLRMHSTSGIDPGALAAMLRDAETPGAGSADAYLELAEHIEEVDLHYLGVLQTRKRQVSQLPVTVEPATDAPGDQRDADLVREFLGRRTLVDELYDVLDSIGKGFSVSEIVWETSERQWMPARIKWCRPAWFAFDQVTGEKLMLRELDGPVDLPPWKFVAHRSKAKSGLTIRGGLARIAAWSWMFKTLSIRDWARFVEAYGQPVRLGKYGPNASSTDMDALERAVANVAADAAALIPESMSIEFVGDTTVRGRSEVFRDLISYIDDKLSIAVLGQTLTTETGGAGSYALGAVHDLVRHDIEASDAAQLAETLERDLVTPIVALNHGPRQAYPRVRIERPPAHDGEKMASVLAALVPLGLRVRVDDVRERLGYAAPGADDDVLSAQPAAAALSRPPAVPLALAAARARDPSADDPLADVLNAIDGDEWQALAAPLIEPVLAQAKVDPNGLLDNIAAAYPEMDADALTERLARILFVADVYGREAGER